MSCAHAALLHQDGVKAETSASSSEKIVQSSFADKTQQESFADKISQVNTLYNVSTPVCTYNGILINLTLFSISRIALVSCVYQISGSQS